MAAIGRSAATTEFAALAMPAPQVVVVHRHSESWVSAVLAGIWQAANPGFPTMAVGKLNRREISVPRQHQGSDARDDRRGEARPEIGVQLVGIGVRGGDRRTR